MNRGWASVGNEGKTEIMVAVMIDSFSEELESRGNARQ